MLFRSFKFEIAVSADEVQASPPDQSTTAIHLDNEVTALPPTERRESVPNANILSKTASRMKSVPNLRPHTAKPSQILPPGYGSASPSSARLALPVPSLPSAVNKASSVRSARSSSTVSTGTGSARSTYGTASSTLRSFLTGSGASKERRRVDSMRPVCVSNDTPPQLDWAPPKLDLQELR